MAFAVIKIKLPKHLEPSILPLTFESANIWNKALYLALEQLNEDFLFNLLRQDTKESKKKFLKFFNSLKTQIQKVVKSSLLHSQTTQAIIDYLIGSIKTAVKNRFKDKSHNYPSKRNQHIIIWKNQAIRFSEDGKRIILPNARGKEPLIVKLKKKHLKLLDKWLNQFCGEIKQAVLTKKFGRWVVNLIIKYPDQKQNVDRRKRLFVDLGEIHPFACYDEPNNQFVLFNGRYIRSLKHKRFKLISIKQKLLAHKQKGSRRYQRIENSLNEQIWKVERQLEDLENKYIKKLLDYCLENKIGTVVIGDVEGIREKAKYNKNANRKIHLIWRFRKLVEKIKNKLSTYGVKVVEVSERYSTQLCPVCGQKNKTNNRNYKCSKCGFKFHRDFVGSLGIARNFFNLKLKKGFKFESKLKEKFKLRVFKVDVKKHDILRRETYIGCGLEPPRRRDRHAPPPILGGDSSASY